MKFDMIQLVKSAEKISKSVNPKFQQICFQLVLQALIDEKLIISHNQHHAYEGDVA